MQRVQVHGPDDVRLDEVAEPAPGPRDAVVRVAACGICGTDLRYVRLGGLAGPMPEPMALGHELAGVVESVGAEVEGLAPGARVVLNPTARGNMVGNGGSEGGFAPRLLVRDAAAGESLFAVPDALPMDVAALAEPLGVGMNAVDRTAARPGDRVAVFGAGPIGLAAVATLRDRGVEDVVAVDLSKRRSRSPPPSARARRSTPAARTRGSACATSTARSPCSARPWPPPTPTSRPRARPPVIPQILQHAKGEARVAIVALHGEIPVNFLLVMMKQLTLRGAMEYPQDYREPVDLLSRRDLSAMISHRFPLESFHEALGVARDPSAGGKVMIELD